MSGANLLMVEIGRSSNSAFRCRTELKSPDSQMEAIGMRCVAGRAPTFTRSGTAEQVLLCRALACSDRRS